MLTEGRTDSQLTGENSRWRQPHTTPSTSFNTATESEEEEEEAAVESQSPTCRWQWRVWSASGLRWADGAITCTVHPVLLCRCQPLFEGNLSRTSCAMPWVDWRALDLGSLKRSWNHQLRPVRSFKDLRQWVSPRATVSAGFSCRVSLLFH